MSNKRAKPRGAKLVAEIFVELREELGDEFSTEELLQAAEALINLSREEYISKAEETERERSDYRNDDVCDAINKRMWQILRQEAHDDSIEDDRLSTDFAAQRFINNLLKKARVWLTQNFNLP